MLHLTLYNYSDAIKRVNKTAYLGTGTAKTGDQLENDQSLLDLSIIIDNSTAPTYNYCHIQELNRYYFIENVVWLGGNAWQLDLHVDVLFTYYSKFTTMNALVAYSTSGSALEYDPRMNYVDQSVVTRTAGNLYPNFLLDQSATNSYTADPFVMIRYYDLPPRTAGGVNHDNETTIGCAFMSLATFNAFIDRYLDNNILDENKRVDFGSKIIDVTNVYFLSQYRLSQATIGQSDLTIRTPKYPAGLTVSLSGAGVGNIYVINTPAAVGALGYALVQGGTIAAATNWDVNGQYITKIPYIGECSFIPAEAGIKTAETIYYAIAIDPYNAQYVITPTDKSDGTGVWYFENTQHINIKTSNAFPVDLSVDNASLKKIQLTLGGIVRLRDVDKSGAAGWGVAALGDYMAGKQIDASEAAHYKYTGEFAGAAEWTPADTKRLVNTSVIVPPDTNYNAYWTAYGKPDHEMRYLYDLTGYAQIEQVHMRYMDTATKTEIDELEALLKQGVIF